MDEDGKGVLVGDAFKTVIGKLEEDMPMEAKEVKSRAYQACSRLLRRQAVIWNVHAHGRTSLSNAIC